MFVSSFHFSYSSVDSDQPVQVCGWRCGCDNVFPTETVKTPMQWSFRLKYKLDTGCPSSTSIWHLFISCSAPPFLPTSPLPLDVITSCYRRDHLCVGTVSWHENVSMQLEFKTDVLINNSVSVAVTDQIGTKCERHGHGVTADGIGLECGWNSVKFEVDLKTRKRWVEGEHKRFTVNINNNLVPNLSQHF